MKSLVDRPLPAHWRIAKLSLVAKLGTGHTPSRSEPAYWEEPRTIPWLTTSDIEQFRDGRITEITETKENISELGLRNSAAVLHPKGTVALSRTASVGFAVIMGRDMATSQDFFTWTCSPALEPRFLLMCLRTAHQDLTKRLAMGSTHKTIYMPDIQQLRVPLPPVEDQRRIVELVERGTARWGNSMDALRLLASLARNRFQAQAQRSILGTPGGPGPDIEPGNPYVWFLQNVRDGLRPRRLKHLLVRNDSGAWGAEPADGGAQTTVVLRSTEIRRDGRWQVEAPARRVLTAAERADTALCTGDILVVTSSGSAHHLGKAAIVDKSVAAMNASFSNFLQRLRCGPGASPRFVWYLLNSTAARAQMAWLGTTTTGLRNLNGSILGSVLHPGLSVDEQERIASALDAERNSLDALLTCIRRQRSLLKERRDALIVAAVTGELDPSYSRESAVAQ